MEKYKRDPRADKGEAQTTRVKDGSTIIVRNGDLTASITNFMRRFRKPACAWTRRAGRKWKK